MKFSKEAQRGFSKLVREAICRICERIPDDAPMAIQQKEKQKKQKDR